MVDAEPVRRRRAGQHAVDERATDPASSGLCGAISGAKTAQTTKSNDEHKPDDRARIAPKPPPRVRQSPLGASMATLDGFELGDRHQR